jgi:hypothetical protein
MSHEGMLRIRTDQCSSFGSVEPLSIEAPGLGFVIIYADPDPAINKQKSKKNET